MLKHAQSNGSSSVSLPVPAFQRMWRHAGLFMALSTVSMAFGANKPPQPPSIEIQGQRYANACLESQTTNLKKILFASQAPDAMQAWHVIDLILCAPVSHANRLAVKNLIKGGVKKMLESTGGEPERKYVGASEELAGKVMAGRQAWNAALEVEPRTIALEYYPNEACIRIVKLRYIGGQWILSELAEACD